MASLNDLHNRLELLKEAVRQKLPDAVTVGVVAAKALAERTIKEKGFGKQYSPTKYPAFFLAGKELNQRGTQFLAAHGVNTEGKQTTSVQKGKKKTKRELTYAETLTNWAEFRESQGLQSKHVDLSYSNKMWANMGPDSPEVVGDFVRVDLMATNREAQDKMNWNRDRYGNFIRQALGDTGMKIIGRIMFEEVLNAIEPYRP